MIIKENGWRHKLINKVRHAYVKAPYFDLYFEEVKNLIMSEWESISDLSFASISWAFEKLGKSPNFVLSSGLNIKFNNPVDRLVAICQEVNSNHYISGPSAKDYIGDGEAFKKAEITVEWMTYDYKVYPQVYDSGGIEMSILDLLFRGKMAMKVPVWWLPLAFFLWSLAICLTSCSIAYATGSCSPLLTYARTRNEHEDDEQH